MFEIFGMVVVAYLIVVWLLFQLPGRGNLFVWTALAVSVGGVAVEAFGHVRAASYPATWNSILAVVVLWRPLCLVLNATGLIYCIRHLDRTAVILSGLRGAVIGIVLFLLLTLIEGVLPILVIGSLRSAARPAWSLLEDPN